ncbi:two component transcriptional regulator, LuxR family [Flavobacterium fontis]|jgi:DNA-binding NarL/FixJ family response regulator|uniref:Two component transcriptional regulator, LuxR family n=1 Tax=Flavobacterium fontis TaxID=1124188 RepID=A0A1M4Z5Q0_9FLAO|nr:MULTISPECIES: response regulator transcription factor [Flavobacterium]MCZ8168744.1 response regulator transcription factor [Flavobacterium sp.]MCZ8296855.1 response regulator transcription factor [Flavobacterium sp.]SHF13127.1 two component transcriptional regulator, LuxR family [Flavobacterium fontis]
MITICIIEDIIEIQKGLQNIIESDPQLRLLASFTNAEEAIETIPKLLPDVVITDINLPQKSGIDCVSELKLQHPDIQFIMFTIYEDNDQVFDALKAGASGYILKNTPPEKILSSIIELYDGGSPMSPKIARKVLSTFNAVSESHVQNLLSKREYEVLELLSKGHLYKEIADQLFISLSTVKRHLNHIYMKLQVQNKTEAVNKLYGKQ